MGDLNFTIKKRENKSHAYLLPAPTGASKIGTTSTPSKQPALTKIYVEVHLFDSLVCVVSILGSTKRKYIISFEGCQTYFGENRAN